MGNRILLLLLTLWLSFPCHAAYFKLNDSYYSFMKDGKWGIMFNDDVVLYPRFDELKSIFDAGKIKWGYRHYMENTYGLFAYKKGDKWGLLNE